MPPAACLWFVGGAPRTGKTRLATRLCRELRVSALSLDILRMGLARGAPSLGLDPEAAGSDSARLLWPVVREMAGNMLEVGAAHVIEGDALLPDDVAALRDAAPERAVRACFLGVAAPDRARRLREIRTFVDGNDWVADLDDAGVLWLIDATAAFSREVRDRCAATGLAYFDVGDDFSAASEAAYHFLTERTDSHADR